METKDLVEALSELVQLDIDAVYAYDQAIKEVDDPIIRKRLREFQEEHRNHIGGLSEKVEKLGGQPPGASKDFKGYIIEAIAAIRSFTGFKGALKAMKTVEEITNSHYGEVVSRKMPPDIKELLRSYFSEEKVHLDYITNNLQAISQ